VSSVKKMTEIMGLMRFIKRIGNGEQANNFVFTARSGTSMGDIGQH